MVRTYKQHVMLVFSLISMYISGDILASKLITANSLIEGKSFAVPIAQHIAQSVGNSFYVGARPGANGQANEFALARVDRNKTSFDPLSPEKVTINNQLDLLNPLFNARIAFLDLIERGIDNNQHPVVVTQDLPATVHVLDSTFNVEQISQFQANNIPDAQGQATSGIVGVTTARFSAGRDSNNVTRFDGEVFVAVKPNAPNSTFGDLNSGIGLLVFGQGEIGKALTVVDAPTGLATNNPRAVALNKTSNVVQIQNPVAMIQDDVSLHWASSVNQLYVGLSVTAGAGAQDGARAVVLGRLDGRHALLLEQIAPDAVFEGMPNKIIGVQGANEQVSIHQVRSMSCSTGLPYLIVRGGNGAPGDTQSQVFALPLTSGNADPANNGKIADKNTEPKDFFDARGTFVLRSVTQPAVDQASMTTADDVAAQVGGGALLAGEITDIFVRADTVYVTVGDQANPGESGMYYSQALFQSNGKIKAWTTWQRVAGTNNALFGLGFDPMVGNFIFLTGESADTIDTVKRTCWSEGDEQGLKPLAEQLQMQFDVSLLGIQGLSNFSPQTPALDAISVLVATGLGKVSLIQTGLTSAQGILIPTAAEDFNNVQSFNDGTITTAIGPNTKMVTIEGGDLNAVGPIITAEFVRDGNAGNNGWLVVGGINGVAILTDDQGNGWDPTADALGDSFNGLQQGFSFKTIGNFKFVRQLISDGDFLYVLTDTQFERIALSPNDIIANNLNSTVLATRSSFAGVAECGTLVDFIVSEKFVLVATNIGLFRVGNNQDISALNVTPDSLNWTRVDVPEPIGPVEKLIAVSQTGRTQDSARMQGGIVYVLSAYRGKNQSQVNRFAIESVDGTAVNNETIKPFTDLYIQNIPSFFANFGQFRDLFVTDGALYLSARNKTVIENPLLTVFPSDVAPQVGQRFLGVRSMPVPVNLEGAKTVTSLLRNLGSGSWVISGDFGIQVNE